MAFAMSRPWKHPKSGVYWFRKAVPEDLRDLVGKREEKRSLQTRDPHEAKREHAKVLVEVESRWTNLRAGPQNLTELEAHQIAVTPHDWWLQEHRDNPSKRTVWRLDLGEKVFALPDSLPIGEGASYYEAFKAALEKPDLDSFAVRDKTRLFGRPNYLLNPEKRRLIRVGQRRGNGAVATILVQEPFN